MGVQGVPMWQIEILGSCYAVATVCSYYVITNRVFKEVVRVFRRLLCGY